MRRLKVDGKLTERRAPLGPINGKSRQRTKAGPGRMPFHRNKRKP